MNNISGHPIFVGKNIEKFRRMRGMKQETFAEILGMSRQTLSKLEQSEEIDREKLEQIAIALGVSVEALESYNDENVVINIETMNHSGVYQYNLNPLEKIVELYDKLLQSEKEKVALLESVINKFNINQ